VNLNRNYEVPSDETINSQTCTNEYGGPAFFSESETSAMRNLLGISKARMWIHFDGIGNKFYVPYSYSSDSFESTLKAEDTHFYQNLQSLRSKKGQMGTYEQLGDDPKVGLLIDYAYSKGVISLEGALESSVVASDDILESVEGYYSYIEDILKYSSFKLNSLKYNNMTENACATSKCGKSEAYSEAVLKFDISNAGLTDTPEGRFGLSLEFANEGYSLMIDDFVLYTWNINETTLSPTTAKTTEYTVTCDQAQPNFISCGVSNMKLDARTQNTIEVKMSSFKTSSYIDQEMQFLYTASFSISYSANSKLGTSSYSTDATLVLPSTAYTDSDSSEEDSKKSNSDLLWDASLMPRHSGNHIEGVAVGLIAGFMSIVFLLMAGLIFYKFRKEIAEDESSDEEEVDHNMKITFIPQSDQPAASGYSGAEISAKMIENARKDLPSLRLNSTNREMSISGSPEKLHISPVRDSPIAVNLNSDSMEEVEIDEIRFEPRS
jgi:hypothetical protein